ncbi:MAG: glycoside hydrolase family 28 protein [Candidatus Sumerlaeia bacterium]
MFEKNSDITEMLQGRIDALSAEGGGEVLIPAGTYHFRPIALKSNVCLNLQAGAKLIASGKREDYFPIGYNHNEMGDVHSAIYAMGQENLTIRGEGEIDLNGESFYHMDKPSKVETVGPEITQEYIDEAPRTYDWRVNQPMFFHECRKVRIDGITITNAPCWTLSFNFCRTLKLTNLTILNSLILPNCDGIHCTGSRDIIIRGCHITAGDDCVALTSITDWNVPCQDVVISDCIFKSASKAISVGYMHSIVRNVLISNVIIRQSNRAFVSMCHPRTGLVENVRMTNCLLEGRCYGGNWWGNGEAIVMMVTPHHIERYREPLPEPRFDCSMRNISFSGLTCLSKRPIGVVASEPLVEHVEFKDITIEITPEERPSLKGNVIDLAPGPENYEITEAGVGIVHRNAQPRVDNVINEKGEAVKVLEI